MPKVKKPTKKATVVVKKSRAVKKNVTTRVCLLLDETGSMMNRKEVTINSVNEYIQSLRKDEGDKLYFTLTTFNQHKYADLFTDADITNVKDITAADYNPYDGTPLYDAIGKSISTMAKKADSEDLIIMAILTDGQENASKEYTLNAVKKLIEEKQKAGWKLAFLAVGLDAFEVFGRMGASVSNTFTVDTANTQMAYQAMASNTKSLRGIKASGIRGSSISGCLVEESQRSSLQGKMKNKP